MCAELPCVCGVTVHNRISSSLAALQHGGSLVLRATAAGRQEEGRERARTSEGTD